MTTTPGNAGSDLTGKPPVVDLATWQAVREELLVREKAHTRDGDVIANWGPTSRPVPQWTRLGATPVETLGRQGHHH
jgi:predicted dithiol-disulfide oxidoreductase (DUF899 family)